MSHRSEKILYNKKTKNLSISRTDRPKQLNINAYESTQNNITSRLESIGSLIIDELKGSERNHLKEQLLTSAMSPSITTMNNLPFSSSKRSLEQVLNDLHRFDFHTQREYRTIGVGDNEINTKRSTTDIDQLNKPPRQSKKMTMINKESQISTKTKRQTKQKDVLNSSENQTKELLNIIPRTICTRSSTLNAFNNNNQEKLDNVIPNRACKRRSSTMSAQTQIDNNDSLTRKSHLNLTKTIGEDKTVVKVFRKKLQSSVPSPISVECSKLINDL